jgi:hypothetical protein
LSRTSGKTIKVVARIRNCEKIAYQRDLHQHQARFPEAP